MWRLLVVKRSGLVFLKYTQCNTTDTVCFMTWWLNCAYLRPHALAQEVICSVWGMSVLPLIPSGKVLLMAVYCTARAWIFAGWTKCHHTSTSHKYLFSTFLPASAFIYWLLSNFIWLCRNCRHTKKTQRVTRPVDGRRIKEKAFCMEEYFRVCFYIPWELPSLTTRVDSHNSGPLWFEETQIKEWRKKKENWAKESKARLNSVLRDIT